MKIHIQQILLIGDKMNWILVIDEGRENMSFSFFAKDLKAAEETALEYFDKFCDDACRHYNEDYFPEVNLYEVSESIQINIMEHIKIEEFNRKYQEEYALATYNRLKKRFEK